MNKDVLINIKDSIEKMEKIHQLKILSILDSENITLNENLNGTFINLTMLDKSILIKLHEYIMYVNKQESQLNNIEEKKVYLENNFF